VKKLNFRIYKSPLLLNYFFYRYFRLARFFLSSDAFVGSLVAEYLCSYSFPFGSLPKGKLFIRPSRQTVLLERENEKHQPKPQTAANLKSFIRIF